MELSQYLDVITNESRALADAAERADLDAQVPSCPDWTLAKLVSHVGEVQQWARTIVEQRASERISRRTLPAAPTGADLIPWFREQAPQLVATLAATDPATAVWTFNDDGTVRFWFRRQAHEVAVHRWDAEGTAGSPSPIAPEVAADGVDEWLGFLPNGPTHDRLTGTGETIHLHCTDTEGEWVVTLADEGPRVTRAHEKSDLAVRGPASNLDLFVLGRVEPTTFEVFGDTELLTRFQGATGF